MGNLTGLFEWFLDKESQESLCLVIKISRAVESSVHREEQAVHGGCMELPLWSCSTLQHNSVDKTQQQTQWLRGGVNEAGTQE